MCVNMVGIEKYGTRSDDKHANKGECMLIPDAKSKGYPVSTTQWLILKFK